MAKTRWSEMTESDLADQFGRRLVRTPQIPARRPQDVKRVPRGTFDYADTLKQQIALCGLPEPLRDHKGIPGRQFKFDLCWPALMIFCEVDGGEWAQTNNQKARHGHAIGMQSDCIKQNLAVQLGWKPYRFVGSQVESGYALGVLEIALLPPARPADGEE